MEDLLASIPQAYRTSWGRMAGMTGKDLGRMMVGLDPATQSMIRKEIIKNIPMGSENMLKAARFAGKNPVVKNALRAVPLLTAGVTAFDVADVIAGPDSLGNKAMDATAMGIGGAIGSFGGPLGIMMGASTGKALSDFTQWAFGDKKTAEQRKMEEALAMLRRGQL